MANIQVRNVPEAVHSELIRRAELAGQSLQQYLSAQLELIASTPSLDDVLNRIDQRSTGSLTAAQAVAAIRDARADR